MLPPRYARHVLVTAIVVWVALRLMLLLLIHVTIPEWRSTLLLVVLPPLVVLLDIRLLREWVLLGNLGIPAALPVTVALGAVGALEVLAQACTRLLAAS